MDQTSQPASQAHETKTNGQESSAKESFVSALGQSQVETAASARNSRSADALEHERRAAVILDGMYQFVALLNPKGDILEVNRAALEGGALQIEELRGTPFWTARWWEVSEESREQLRDAIRRAAAGEFVRYEVDVYGEQAGLATITIDFSIRPIRGESGEIEYLLPEGRNITERKQAEEEIARQSRELRDLNERLKELDRLKTQFFANVSHEFRTPLTLMLGPLEDALANAHGVLPLGAAADLAASHRNALRLLKLVNTMLDFSRIEAGRVQASYQPVDLAAFTAELASNFRSACEKAGLRLIVDCAPLSAHDPVYVDRDMWEKIILNLLSNAFKFTLKGEIEVRLDTVDRHAYLTVRDTGVGIASDELPRMFERFHRIEHTRGRTHEGTGIGLALVQELVKLHGGTVSVDSVAGEGSTFAVALPFGTAHLDPERIGKVSELASTSIMPSAFIEEALGWLPDEELDRFGQLSVTDEPRAAQSASNEKAGTGRPSVLWADDNADMRGYVTRLLGGRFDVRAVPDGEAALAAARAHPPDLVLSDVMMPKLDGFGLLRALRADPALREIPVILLSARAGEESRVEGIEVGADDYLVKPFSARELIARVETHVTTSRIRREAKTALRDANDALTRSNADLQQFAYSASHDLQEPLRMVATYSELLRREFAGQLGPNGDEYIGYMIDGALRMEQLLRDLRAYTMVSSAGQKPTDDVDADQVLEKALANLDVAIKESGASIRSTALPRVRIRDLQLELLLQNLIGNAIHYRSDEPPRIYVAAEKREKEWLFSVQDNGIGIDTQYQEQIFEMFKRLHSAAAHPGTGMGLAICQRIVERAGGRIWVESGLGRGSTFFFTIPSGEGQRDGG
jgi:PAS domain S-box-containing protein